MTYGLKGRPNKSEDNYENSYWIKFLDWFPGFFKKKFKLGEKFIEGKTNQEHWKAENEKHNVNKTDAETLSIIMDAELKRAQCLAIYHKMEEDKFKRLLALGANEAKLQQFELKTYKDIQDKINQLHSLLGGLDIKPSNKNNDDKEKPKLSGPSDEEIDDNDEKDDERNE